MPRSFRPATATAAAALSLFALSGVAHAGFGHDPYSPVVISPMATLTLFSDAAADGSGGMFVTWVAGNKAYVTRLTSTGAYASGWSSAGVQLSAAVGTQSGPNVLGDGSGGAFVAWSDGRGATADIYVTRLTASGTLAAGWPANGLLASTGGSSTVKDDVGPLLVTDAAGGVFVVWTLNYGSTDVDIYGSHVTSTPSVAWSGTLFGPLGEQFAPRAVADGNGGLFVGFQDNENGSYTHAKVMRVSPTGTLSWGPLYIGTGASTYNQVGFDIAADGTGGVFGVCAESSYGTYTNIAGNHFLANGTNDPTWGGYKTIAPESNLDQGSPVAASDGSGGLITAFADFRYGTADVFVQRTGPYGLPYNGWPDGGVAASTASANQWPSSMVPDGSGGVVIAFTDDRLGLDYLLYAVRVLGNGNIAPGWSYGGTAVDLGGEIDTPGQEPMAVSDGSGGAMFAWRDTRGAAPFGLNGGVYAQNVDRFGALGDSRPFISRIADVPNDQGGELSLQWTASPLDASPSRTVSQYTIWRRVPGGAPESAARAAGTSTAPRRRTTGEGAEVAYWEYVSTQPALMLPGYSAVVSTTSDSMTAGNPRTSLMVAAESAGGTEFWLSPPDSGYSVDNVPPLPPAPFLGTYSAGVAALHWGANTEPDLAGYRLYRGSTAGFVPGASNLVTARTDTSFNDPAGAPFWYRLTAIDIHGNESASTLLLPSGATGVAGGAAPPRLALASPEPNPAYGPTTLRCSLPRETSVRLAIYDAGGRLVRMLADGPRGAGEFTTTWDLRDEAGRDVGAGLYFARLEAEGHTRVQRIVALK